MIDMVLAGFIRFLEGHDLIEFDIDGDAEAHFVNRLKLQKYVFLAKRFGMPFNYEYDMYLYGPYSRQLTTDYYRLARCRDQYDVASTDLPGTFQKDAFLKAVRNDPAWLEVASTLLSKNENIVERSALLDTVYNIKHEFGREFIAGVLEDLSDHRKIRLAVP